MNFKSINNHDDLITFFTDRGIIQTEEDASLFIIDKRHKLKLKLVTNIDVNLVRDAKKKAFGFVVFDKTEK